MPIDINQAKARLDLLIAKARVDLYKPVQIAEVLRQCRLNGAINAAVLGTYRNPSVHWRDEVTLRLLGKKSTSSARFQHDLWNATAMPPDYMAALDQENKNVEGVVERYIYMRFAERQGTVSKMIAAIATTTPDKFDLSGLLKLFVSQPGIRRSIDKAYEIVTHSLFETIVTSLGATVRVNIPDENRDLLAEFSGLAKVLLGLEGDTLSWEIPAHVYRVGVTNAADRGLDMWANFGPAVQVKHLTLNVNLASSIVDQVESDHIVLVCRDTDAQVIEAITRQIGWGRRVRGILRESELLNWYELCLRGKYSDRLAAPLLQLLKEGFRAEFPLSENISDFLIERGYLKIEPPSLWRTDIDSVVATD